jgi:AsmA protein
MKKVLIGLGVFIALFVVIAVAVPLFIDADRFRPRVEQEASAALGRKVTVGHLNLSILRGAVVADDVKIADDTKFSSQPFLTAKALRIGAEIWPLITSKEMKISSVRLEEPKINLIKNAAGKWNFESLGAGTPAKAGSGGSANPPLSVASLKISHGEITLTQANKKNTYTNVNAEVSNFSDTSEFPFNASADTPGGGSLKIDGEAGPLAKGDMIATPMQAEVDVKQLDLARAGVVDPASGIAGKLDYTGQVKSDGKTLTSEGKATTSGLKVVKSGAPAKQAITMDYATKMDLARKVGEITRGDIVAGNTRAKLTGTYDTKAETPVLNAKFKGDNMPLDSLVGLLPAFGVVLPQGTQVQGGTVSTDMLIQGPVDKLVINGPLNVANTKVTGFDMKQRASAISALANMPSGSDLLVQALNSKLRVAPEGIRADDLNLIIPKLGTIAGAGVIGANNSLNFKMRAKLEGGGGLLGVGSALTTLGQSKGELPFLIQGTTSNPVFLPDMAGAISSTAKAPVQTVQGVGGMLGGIFGKKKK